LSPSTDLLLSVAGLASDLPFRRASRLRPRSCRGSRRPSRVGPDRRSGRRMHHRVERPEAPGRRSSSGWRQVAGANTLSQRVAFLLRDVAGGDRRVDARDRPSLIASTNSSWLMPRRFTTSLNKSEAGLFAQAQDG
jgi:hypothetical protein